MPVEPCNAVRPANRPGNRPENGNQGMHRAGLPNCDRPGWRKQRSVHRLKTQRRQEKWQKRHSPPNDHRFGARRTITADVVRRIALRLFVGSGKGWAAGRLVSPGWRTAFDSIAPPASFGWFFNRLELVYVRGEVYLGRVGDLMYDLRETEMPECKEKSRKRRRDHISASCPKQDWLSMVGNLWPPPGPYRVGSETFVHGGRL